MQSSDYFNFVTECRRRFSRGHSGGSLRLRRICQLQASNRRGRNNRLSHLCSDDRQGFNLPNLNGDMKIEQIPLDCGSGRRRLNGASGVLADVRDVDVSGSIPATMTVFHFRQSLLKFHQSLFENEAITSTTVNDNDTLIEQLKNSSERRFRPSW